MDIITHGIVMPWLIDPTYLLQLAERFMLLFTLLVIAGLTYVGLYHLLSNRPIKDVQQRLVWPLISNTTFKEGHCNEA
jgi:hypothetical protein